MTKGALRLLRVGMNVSELDRASAFYHDALGFGVIDRNSYDTANFHVGDDARVRTERLQLGRQEIELYQFDPPGAPYPPDSTAADLWFQHFAIVTRDMEGVFARLAHFGTTPISLDGPQRLPPSTGSVIAYKFRDPDGHPLELIHFPRRGVEFAQVDGSSNPTVGIDHSALSVADATRSIAFYAALGLSLGSRQLNTGSAQDRLDGLCCTSVEVIAMMPADSPTPHVELLAYTTPRGRTAAPSSSGGDTADSRLIFEVADLTRHLDELAAAGISALRLTGISALRLTKDREHAEAAELRDPDGHLIVLLQRT